MPDGIPLTLLDAGLRGMLLALLLLLAAVLLRERPRLPAARATVALCLGLVVQVLSSTPWFEATASCQVQSPLIGISVANAVLFWLFVCALFDDGFRLRAWHAGLWLTVVLLVAARCTWLAGTDTAVAQLLMGFQRGVPLVFAVLAAVAAARQWREDLVEGRRRVRAFTVVAGVAYTLLMLMARLASPQGRLSELAATVDLLLLLLAVLPAAWLALRLSANELFPSALPQPALQQVPQAEPAPTAAPPDPEDDRLADTLQRLMEQQQLYREEGLTVAGLAARLRTPEYRLRRVINQRLGHRNFNAYINGLRLQQACTALADPAQRQLPVLSIALDAGFQSIGPFNRAFKAATGLTPTEFRKQKLADS
jgi:AraC-like DNA-binding protein